jgi:hypothetical protein
MQMLADGIYPRFFGEKSAGRRGSKHNIDRREYLVNAMQYAKRGNELAHAKLNPESVRQIRIEAEQGITAKCQASEYGVHIRTIEAIRSYKTWQSVR